MMRLVNRLLILGLILSGIACKKQESLPTDQLKIAYNVGLDMEKDDYEVFVMNFDGSGKHNVTNSPGVEWTYFAYEDKLYYISDRDTTHRYYYMYECDWQGNNLRKITNFRLADSWHNSRFNNTEMVVKPHKSVDSAFYIINMNGDILKRIDPGLAYFNDPQFSPDGNQIVFRGAKKKFKKDNGYSDELYIINSDGSGLRQLTHYPQSDTTALWWEYKAGPPRWHDALNMISYGSVRAGKMHLFSIKADGSDLKQITNGDAYETWHDWTRDGKWLIYDGHIKYGNNKNNYDIYLMDLESKEMKRLTTDTLYEQAPVFLTVKE